MKKFVVSGYKESGKTTLITKILDSWEGPVLGFFTKKFPDRLTPDGLCPIYIYSVGSDPIFDDAHLIGLGGEGTHYTNSEVFDEIGTKLITADDASSLIVMDEVGFLETDASLFKEKVFEVLRSDNPVVLIMKQKMQLDFMKALKDFPGIEFIELSIENRNWVAEHIIKELKD